MHVSVYAVLLTCLYGSSFGAPIDTKGLLSGLPVVGPNVAGLTEGLPILGKGRDPTGLTKSLPLISGLSKRVGDMLEGSPVDAVTRLAGNVIHKLPVVGNSVDLMKRDIIGGLVSSIPVVGPTAAGVVHNLPVQVFAKKDLLSGLTKTTPGTESGGGLARLTKDIPLVGKGLGLSGPAGNLTKSLPIVGKNLKRDLISSLTGLLMPKKPVAEEKAAMDENAGVDEDAGLAGPAALLDAESDIDVASDIDADVLDVAEDVETDKDAVAE